MNKILSVVTEGPRFIQSEQIEQLQEIKTMCYFGTAKERKSFLSTVAAHVGADSIETITVEQFEDAYAFAKSILHKIGEAVYKPCNNKTFARVESDNFNSFDIE